MKKGKTLTIRGVGTGQVTQKRLPDPVKGKKIGPRELEARRLREASETRH